MDQFPYENIEELGKYIEATTDKTPGVGKSALDYLESMGQQPMRFNKAMLSYMILPMPQNGIAKNFLKNSLMIRTSIKIKTSLWYFAGKYFKCSE